MKKYILFLNLMILVLWSTLSAQQPAEFKIVTGNWQGEEIEYVAGQILVCLAQETDAIQATNVFTDLNLTVLEPFDRLNIALLRVPDGINTLSMATRLANNSRFRFAEPNMVIRAHQTHPNDPYYAGTTPATYPHQYALHNTGQDPPDGTSDADIDAPEAWEYETGSSSILIGVLDSGIPLENGELSHPDLNDANRYILGQDFVPNDGDNVVKDLLGHGTHVTGIIAAETNNNAGIAGVNWNCQILVEQVFDDSGYGDWSFFKNAIYHAADNGADIINFSGGALGYSATADTAVKYAHDHNIVQVYSTGNSGQWGVAYPAKFAYYSKLPGYANGFSSVISVAATQYDDERASYSSYSRYHYYVTVAAPGGAHDGGYPVDSGDIFSTTPNYTVTSNGSPWYVSQNYGYLPGTSMAAPHVAGLAGLILAKFPSYTPAEVRALIEQSAEDVNAGTYPGFDKQLGYGRINAFYAVAPPATPQNFEVSRYTDIYPYRPQLTWTANTESDLTGYSIERKIDNGNWAVLDDDVDKEATSFIDYEILIWYSQNNQTAYYRMRAYDYSELYSDYTATESINFHIQLKQNTDGSEEETAVSSIPDKFDLHQNYPNPGNPTTQIIFSLADPRYVTLKVFNMQGQEVRSLVNDYREAGAYSVIWDGKNNQGVDVPSGIYLYRLRAGEHVFVKKLTLLK